MGSPSIQERIVAIALCAVSVLGTLALFGSVPLLAEIATRERDAFSGEKHHFQPPARGS